MIPTSTEIVRRITDGTLLSPELIAALDHDSILDERDGDAAFEAQWMQCYNEIEAKWSIANVDKETVALAEDIRRESFLSVSRVTNQHEIASYVSEDFDIIIRGCILELDNEFLNKLWDAYNQNEIPTPATCK